jgi:hypothetical protein
MGSFQGYLDWLVPMYATTAGVIQQLVRVAAVCTAWLALTLYLLPWEGRPPSVLDWSPGEGSD